MKTDRLRKLLLLIIMTAISTTGFSQDKSFLLKGQVSDEKGLPIEGVSIVILNRQLGAISDQSGKFSIEVQKGDSLSFSSLGYGNRRLIVRNNSPLFIELVSKNSELNEVVVIGYGIEKKADVTGAISSVQGESISKRNTTNVSEALQGALPGVMVSRNNGAPGSSSTIRIRGITTIGNNTPLILVDGVPVGSIDEVNPQDIDNISVLKDASAASIYGARAAAGVILITTKKAKSGELSLEFSYNHSWIKPTVFPKFGNAKDYMKMINEIKWNDIGNPSGQEYSVYRKNIIEDYDSLNAVDPDTYPNTDMKSYTLKNYSIRNNYQLSISGGSKFVQSRFSIGYENSNGLYMKKGFERITLRANNDIIINNKLSGFINFGVNHSLAKDPSVAPTGSIYRMAPIYAAVWSNGLIAGGKDGSNIYGQLLKGGWKKGWSDKISGQAGIEYKPLEGLSLKALVSPEIFLTKEKDFLKKVEYTAADDPDLILGTLGSASTTRLTEFRNDAHQINNQFIINYNGTFQEHHFDVLVGYEGYYYFHESLETGTDQMILKTFPYLDLGNSNFLSNSGNAYENAYRSYFGRLIYDFRGKYLLNGSLRKDGSSRFYKDDRWGMFPSISAGWIISKEPFMKNLKAINFLKIRGSYGTLGNERIGNYPYQAKIDFSQALLFQGSDVVAEQGAAQQAYAIRDLTWETTRSVNIGVNLNILDNRLKFEGDLYKKNTNGMLLELAIPMYMGFNNPEQNAGKMSTNGWETNISWDDSFESLKYGISFNISNFKSKMGYLSGIQFLGDQVKFEGSQFDEWYGYISEGLYQTKEDADNSAQLYSGVQPGDIKYKDISGPDGIPDGIINQYDKVLLGGSLPQYTYGGNVYVNFKNFDFSLVFQGVGKQISRLPAYAVQPYQGKWGNIPQLILGKYWSAYNTVKENERAKYPRLTDNYSANNYSFSDYWLFNGKYFRLKNIVLGYTFPTSVLSRASIKNLRIFATVSDLFSLNRYPKGWDPEVGNSAYPITTTYSFGASVKF